MEELGTARSGTSRRSRAGRQAGSRLYLGEEFGHGGAEGGRELLHDQDGRHPLAAFQQADVVAVQVGPGRKCLLRKVVGLASSSQDGAELLLERMHGSTTRLKKASANQKTF